MSSVETLAEVRELVSHTARLPTEAEETAATVLQTTFPRQNSIDSNGCAGVVVTPGLPLAESPNHR